MMKPQDLLTKARKHFAVKNAHNTDGKHIRRVAKLVSEKAPPATEPPVVFFNASTRLSGVSLNAGFALVTSWSLRMQGVPVVNFVCERGMTQCVLGTDRNEPPNAPPCKECVAESDWVYSFSDQVRFAFEADPALDQALEGLNLAEFCAFRYQNMPLGELVLPSARWILRRHNLIEDVTTLRILREYIRSAWSLAKQFDVLLGQFQPQAVVVFNGMQYPEATARWVARQRGLKVYSHEVGLRPMSAFFTPGDATAYPLDLPADFALDEQETARLNEYLEKRFKGNFQMAGVKFWPEMSALDPAFIELIKRFLQVVPIFTNVIFDTSQPHANTLFEDMFAWLDEIVSTARRHRETLFVIRAHPDEARKGKASEESVADWVARNNVEAEPNIKFIPAEETISSYDLIRMAKLVLVYNSTIGLEASILGVPVLAAGKSRYSPADVVWLPAKREAYLLHLEGMLSTYDIDVPQRFARNARRFLYYQLFRSSLSFEDFLEEDGVWPGYVRLKEFDLAALLPENSTALRVISDGLLRDGNFILERGDL
jgi:hypothetical protein